MQENAVGHTHIHFRFVFVLTSDCTCDIYNHTHTHTHFGNIVLFHTVNANKAHLNRIELSEAERHRE